MNFKYMKIQGIICSLSVVAVLSVPAFAQEENRADPSTEEDVSLEEMWERALADDPSDDQAEQDDAIGDLIDHTETVESEQETDGPVSDSLFAPENLPRSDVITTDSARSNTRDETADLDEGPLEITPRQVTVRALEKVTARITDIVLGVDETVRFKSLDITMRTCNKRPPEEPPETTAFLEIVYNKENGDQENVFTGWMFASSPALNALEHAVYDVWVIDCKIEEPEAAAGNE